MNFSREVILKKINLLMGGALTPQDVYEWALSVALTPGFENFSRQDKAAGRAVQVMMDVSEDRIITSHELKMLEYCRQCLTGQRVYEEELAQENLPEVDCSILDKWKGVKTIRQETEPLTQKEHILHQLRICVYGFAVILLIASLWMLFALGGPWSYKRSVAAFTFPFLIYAFLLLWPMKVLVNAQRLFWTALLLSIFVSGYFWFSFFQMLFLLHWGKSLIFFIGAAASSASLWLIIYEKYMKKDRKDLITASE